MSLVGVYECPEIVLPMICALAPAWITMPFCAIVPICPRPVIVLFSTFTDVLRPNACTPFFW